MDPLTIATNAFSSAKALYSVGKTLYDEIESYRQQSKTIERFCDSINSLCILLQSIKDFVAQQINIRYESEWANIRMLLETSLRTCHTCTDELIGSVSKLEKHGNSFLRQVKLRFMETNLDKQEKEIDRQMIRLSITFALFQNYFGGASTDRNQNALLRDFNDLLQQNKQPLAKLSPEQRHMMIAMEQLLDTSLQPPISQPHSAQASSQTHQPQSQIIRTANLSMSLESFLMIIGGLPGESKDILVKQSMVRMLDLVYSTDDLQMYGKPIYRLYHLLDGARYDLVTRSEVRPLLIQAVSQCRFSAHGKEYVKMIGDAETINATSFQALFYSLVEVSIRLEHDRVYDITKRSYYAGMLELELEMKWKKANEPDDRYNPQAVVSQYSSEISFQYCAWALSRVWTQRLCHLAQLWRTPGNTSFSAEEEIERILELVQITSRFGDILLVNGKLLDLLELAHLRLPFDETAYKEFPHDNLQRLGPACRDIFAELTSLVIEFKTVRSGQLEQNETHEYERDFSKHRMKYITKPMKRDQWIHLGISARLNRIMDLIGGELPNILKSIERCTEWGHKYPNFEKTVLSACKVTESFQRELHDELKAKISNLQQKALSNEVSLTLTSLHLSGFKPRILDRSKKLVAYLQVSDKANDPKAAQNQFAPTQRSSSDAPQSWNKTFHFKLHPRDLINITISYESNKKPLASVSFRPSELIDFYKGEKKDLIIAVPNHASLRMGSTISVPPSSLSKQEYLPRDHRPGGWIGRHTTHQPARSYQKRYLTGEYTLLDPIEMTARKTVVPMLAETIAKVPVVGGVVGAVTDQFGMASGFLYGKLWGSWKWQHRGQ